MYEKQKGLIMSTNIASYDYATQGTQVVQPQAKPVKAADEITVPPPATSENGSNLLMKSLTGLALIATGLYLGKNLLKPSGNIVKTLETFKLQGGKFNRGVATLPDGSTFTGKIKYTSTKGDNYLLEYLEGKIQKVSKNIDEFSFVDPNKASNSIRKWNYSPEGKVTEIRKASIVDDKIVEQALDSKKLKNMQKFTEEGGKIVDGKAINADGTPYTGYLAEVNEQRTLIKGFAEDGRQVSERLNKSLTDRDIRTKVGDVEHYVLDEAGLIKREKDAQKLTTKMKNWFKNLFTKKAKPTNTEQANGSS